MSDDRLTLRQADQARVDFAIIGDELEVVHARLARLPARQELWRTALIGMLSGSASTILLAFAFWR
jgi:hypothetical protein